MATITVGSATASAALTTFPGRDYVMQASSASAYVGDVQLSLDGNNWADAYYDGTNKVTLGTVRAVRLTGGPLYRLNVTTWAATVTVQIEEAGG